ncbi:MAG: carbon-nitrogen hydrolase family protein [Acidobacteria bacterium]|nr:carbon-nitrogen hydrolase family protein [Acidobacteriota bacterium]
MSTARIALANIRLAATPAESVSLAEAAIAEAGARAAQVICFPECYVPGYRWPGVELPPPDPIFLERAWDRLAQAARRARITVILGTERPTQRGLLISALVLNPDGSVAGWQDKEQLDPSEDATFVPGSGRHIFHAGPLAFGVVICHEGWRYPETVRAAARQGARLVFHPHADIGEPGGYQPADFLDRQNTFHEKAMLCRAAENTIYFASVNAACPGSNTTSAIIRPDGTPLCHQPYGVPGLLIADLDLTPATRLLATRCRAAQPPAPTSR